MSAARESEAPRLSGRYRFLDVLGKGGMGAVYRVRDLTLDRVVALKQLKLPATSRSAPMLKALFEREYHTLARLKHPRIIEVYDYGVGDGGPYYTMELLEGKDLQQLSPLPYRTACRVLRDIASSLALLHAHRLLHRDVTPRNVRMTGDGRAKLLDFGTLTTFGAAAEVIGTPLSIAPEALQRRPLDQRADLFGLGALAYWALTGKAAYPVRSLGELPKAWLQAPQPPSAWAPDIPAALDSLCLALLNPDALARPASAAAVIDQLNAIAELPAEDEHEQAAESYLSSGRLVGREPERNWMRQRFLRAVDGQGSPVVLEGPPGIGRTRLLHELCLDAQLQAIVPLRADAQAVPLAYGVPVQLALQLLTVAPEIARTASELHAALLAQLSPELRDKLEVAQVAALPADPNERRARFQAALHDFFVSVARSLPLLIAVDNLQAADDDSAAFLASLARECRRVRLLVLVTQRSGDAVYAPGAVRALRQRSGHLKLAGLRAAACEDLVRSLFGDVDHAARVAKLLHARSAGNPRQCMDLAQLLVQKRIARYDAGTWILPHEVSGDELPDRIEELLEARLLALSAPARALADALSIHAVPVALERCRSLSADLSEREIYAALDELVAEQILLAERGHYRFEHAGLREAIRARLPDARRCELHARAAQALAAAGAASSRAEAAWHVMHSGDELAGADMLAAVGYEFLRSEEVPHSVEQVVRALETALDVYEREGRSPYEQMGLMFTLIPLSFFVDRRATLKYAERALTLGLRLTGLGLSQRLSRVFGTRLGLALGMFAAALRFAVQKRRGLGFDLRTAIARFCGLVPATVGTHNICYDIAAVARFTRALEPLRLFGPDHVATLMHDFARSQLAMGEGRESEASVMLERLDAQFNRSEVVAAFGGRWKAMYGGILYARGILSAYVLGAQALEHATAMEQLGVRVWAMAADQVRMLYHALRGEAERVSHYRERVESSAVQGSSMWQAELFWPVLMLGSELLTKDTIGARRTWEQLARRCGETPSLEVYARAARAAYLAMRGETGAAIALYEALLPELGPRKRVAWQTIRAHFAQTLIAAGDAARAKALMVETLAHASPADLEMVGRFLEPQRQLALATAALGEFDEAVQQLDGLLAKHGAADQPLLIGLLHKARAEVALQLHDLAGFDTHAAALEARFRGAQNSGLIAQWEQLQEAAVRAGLRGGAKRTATSGVHQLQIAADPQASALRLILRNALASQGFLYEYDGACMQLCSASGADDPPAELEQRLNDLAQRLEFEAAELGGVHAPLLSRAPLTAFDAETQAHVASDADRVVAALEAEDATEFVVSEPPPGGDDRYQALVLSTQREGRVRIVGGVILQAAPGTRLRIDPTFFAELASALHDRWSGAARIS